MNSFNFLIDKLTHIVETCSNIRIRYKYIEEDLLHIVEVVPEKTFQEQIFLEIEKKFVSEFHEKFKYENLCFISNDDPIGINNPDFVMQGNNFGNIITERFINDIKRTEWKIELSCDRDEEIFYDNKLAA
jgi:hypothetical protein